MALGMSREEYWFGSVLNALDYVEADRYRLDRLNERMWIQGMYVADATFTAISNAFAKNDSQRVAYPSKPYEFEQPAENEVEDNESSKALLYMQNMMKAGANWGSENR